VSPPMQNAIRELANVKSATGGAAWDSVSRITAVGDKTSFGLHGKYRSLENLSDGFFTVTADYGIFTNAEGLDSTGRWRQDNSGQIHRLDSEEAKEVAITEAYLAGRGYLFPDRMPASFVVVDPIRDGETTFLQIVATPVSGRAATFWINSSTHLIDRAVLRLSVGEKVIRYTDYRRVGPLTLPFSISVQHRDENETGVATIHHYEIAAGSEQPKPGCPSPPDSDAFIADGTREARGPGYLDPGSGFFIVLAKINGRGPFPFILDTGGHEILTPLAAHELGLQTFGKGFSQGAGAGATPTEFTKVESIAIGLATFTGQPFTILHIDLGMTRGPDRKLHRIAGILGLGLFERFIVTIDYETGVVILRRHLDASGLKKLRLTFTSDMPVVEASLDGHSGWFNVDTGNNIDLIVFRKWASANQVTLIPSRTSEMRSSSVGGEIHMQSGTVPTFRLSDKELNNVAVLLAPDDEGSLSAKWEAGNIGNAVLRQFKSVTFDYSAESMYLK
jgi:Aspartyl protease